MLLQIGFLNHSLAQNSDPTPEQIDDFRARLNANEKNAPLKALFKLDQQTAAIEQLVPELAKLVANGDEPTMRAAIRCLGQVAEKAEPALVALVAKLDHRDYLVRAELNRVLNGMGQITIPVLKKELMSPSPRVRSSALSVLNNLTKVDFDTLEKLQNDPDVRVRICVAEAWKKHGPLGVERIAELLKDPESVVAVGAALALRFHFEDTSLSIPALIESLTRKEVGWASAMALQSYGVEAQKAIPMLIQSIPLGYVDHSNLYGQGDYATVALDHIGPPRLVDLDLLRQLLDDANPTVCAFAARLIGQLGQEAISARDDLERMFQVSMRGHKKIMEQAAAISDEDERDNFLDSSPDYQAAAEAACTAIWRIGRNTKHFIQLTKELARQAEFAVHGGDDSPFPEFAKRDVPYLFDLLDSPNEHVRSTGSYAFWDIRPEVVDLATLAKIRQSKDEDAASNFRKFAEKMDERLGAEIGIWLIEDLEKGTMDLSQFARIVAALKIRDAKSIKALNEGLKSKNQYLPHQCLAALAAVAEDANQAASLLVFHAGKNTSLRRTALESLLTLPGPNKLVVPFAIECLGDSDYWIRHRAIAVLARIGPDANRSLPELAKLLTQESAGVDSNTDEQLELSAALAVATISGNKTEFQRRFDSAIDNRTDDADRSRYYMLNILEELGPKADEYFDFIAQLLHMEDASRSDERNNLNGGLRLLGVVRSPRAIELLQKYANDRDWLIRRQAIRILKSIEDETIDP